MKKILCLALTSLFLPATLSAEVVVRRLEAPIVDLHHHVQPPPAAAKAEVPASLLVLPYFEVDKADPSGATTLYAVRNTRTFPVDLEINYFDTTDIFQRTDNTVLGPKETLTINIFDVDGLAVDGNGIARGFASFVASISPMAAGVEGAETDLLVGDYFQVTQNEDFATGERMLNYDLGSAHFDACFVSEARFLNGGAFDGGTDFLFLFFSPGGADPESDPRTALATIYDDTGVPQGSVEIFTDQTIVKLTAADLTAQFSGTVEFALNETLGSVQVAYKALGRFSVGFKAACREPEEIAQ